MRAATGLAATGLAGHAASAQHHAATPRAARLRCLAARLARADSRLETSATGWAAAARCRPGKAHTPARVDLRTWAGKQAEGVPAATSGDSTPERRYRARPYQRPQRSGAGGGDSGSKGRDGSAYTPPRPRSPAHPRADEVRGAPRWDALLAPASDLGAMSDPGVLGLLLVRALQLAPQRSAPRAELERYNTFVSHALDLSARLMQKAAAAERQRVNDSSSGNGGGGSVADAQGELDDNINSSSGGSSGGTPSTSSSVGANFEPWQLATILWQLSRAGIPPGQRWERALWKSTAGSLAAGQWDAQNLSKAAFALGRLKPSFPPSPDWQAAFLTAWSRERSNATPQQLSGLLWALAALGWRVPADWAAEARADVVESLPSCDPRDVAWMVWGVAILSDRAEGSSSSSSAWAAGSHETAPAPPAIPRRAPSRPAAPLSLAIGRALEAHMPSMGPKELSLVAAALGRLDGSNGSSADTFDPAVTGGLLTQALEEIESFSFDELSDLLSAIARLPTAAVRKAAPDGFAAAASARLAAQVAACRAQQLAAAVWAMGTLGWRDQRAAAGRLLWRSEALLSSMTLRDQSTFAVGLARLGLRPPPVWIFNFLNATRPRLPDGPPQALANVAWALARLTVRPDRRAAAWIAELVSAVAAPASLGRITAQQLGLIIYALGTWRYRPANEAAWGMLQRKLRAVLPQATARNVAMVCHGLGRMRRWGERAGGEQGVEGDGSSSSTGGDRVGGGVVEPATLRALLKRTSELMEASDTWTGDDSSSSSSSSSSTGGRGDRFSPGDLANTGRGLALLGARPNVAWLARWRSAVERADAGLDTARARSAAVWATAVLEGRATVGSGPTAPAAVHRNADDGSDTDADGGGSSGGGPLAEASYG